MADTVWIVPTVLPRITRSESIFSTAHDFYSDNSRVSEKDIYFVWI
jgi:hypothetical protein